MPFIDPDEMAAPAARGFVDPDEDNMAFRVVNGIPQGYNPNFKPKEKKPVDLHDRLIGAGEGALTALSGAAGGVLAVPRMLANAALGYTDKRQPGEDSSAPFGRAMAEYTYHPRTEEGQKAGDFVGEAFNQVGMPLIGVHLPNVGKQVNSRLKGMVPEAFKEIPEAPKAFVDPDVPVKQPIDPAGQHELFAPDEQGKVANPYGAAEGVWRTDENGIPIRADLSMDAQNAGNPLQRNLFGDQLEPTRNPVGQSANLFDVNGLQENIPITEAMDNMGWAQRRGAINSQLRGAVESSGELEGAKAEANRTGGGGQRGAIDIKEVADGFQALLDGVPVGYLKSNLPRGMAQRIGEDANVDIVHVAPEARGMGVGKALYQAFNDMHDGNIAPSGKTSPSAWALWKRNYPDKVDKFVSQEAGRLSDGAPMEQVLGNITDPEVRRSVVEQANPLRVLNSQRGGIDMSAVGDAVKKMLDKVAPVKLNTNRPLPKGPNEGMGVPGLANAVSHAIPKDPDVAAVKAAVLKEGGEDGKIALASLRAGANMVGDQRKSALINAAHDFVMNGVKRAELNIRQFVQPVEAALGRLVRSDVMTLAGVFKDEMFNGMQYSADQLAKLGLSNKQIEVYSGMRDMFTKALERQNEARVAQGMEPITAKDGYMASRWGGRFRIPVYDTSGKLVWYIAETSKRSAEKALDWLEKKGNVPVDRLKSKLEIRGVEHAFQKNNRGYLEDSYLNMLSVLDKNDPRVAHVKSIMEDAMSDRAYDSLGQAKHFEPKAGVRGFIGDQPWRNGAEQAYALFRSQMSYAKNAFHWAESQQAVSGVKGLLADKEIAEQQPNNSRYVRDYVKNHLGYGEDPAIASIESRLSAAMGYDKSHAAQFVNKAKAMFLMQKLALNLGYYGSQGLQMLNSIPEHGLLTSHGYKHNMLKTIALSTLDMGAGFVKQGSDVLNLKAPELRMSHLGKDAWRYMEDNGISNRNIMDEAAGLGESPIFEKGVNAAGSAIALSEKIIRTHAFLQFAHHLDQSGKFKSRPELFAEAEKATNRSMVDFRREERAQVFAKGGLIGSAASTLKSYLVNYYNNMGRYGQEAMNGNPRALLYALGLQGAVYGVLNLPGMQEVHDTWELFKKALPDAAFQHVKDTNIKKTLIDTQGDWAYGGVSKLTGANLANRGNIAVDQQFALDGMFPFISDQAKQAAAVAGAVTNPNQTTFAQAAYAVAPNGPVQGMISQTEPFQAGTKADGTTIFQKPSKIGEHEHDYARTPEQIDLKNHWGVTSLEEARNKDLTWNVNSDEKNLKARRDANVTGAFDALVRNDKEAFEKNRDYFMKFNGDPGVFVDSMLNEAFKMKVSREALSAIKNNPNLTDLQKLKQLRDLLGQVR